MHGSACVENTRHSTDQRCIAHNRRYGQQLDRQWLEGPTSNHQTRMFRCSSTASSPTLLCLTLWPLWSLLMSAFCHPHHSPCRLTQKTALCSNSELSSVPGGLPDSIEDLHLNHNHIQMLQDDSLSRYVSLRTLSCADNLLETVGSKLFHNSPHLESLNLAANNLHVGYQQTSLALLTLSRLRVLDLSKNQLTEDMVSVLLQNMTSLEYLNLSRNLLLRLDESSFSDLHQLRELDLQRNMLFEIDGSFDHLHRLQRLNLAFNYLPCLVHFHMTQLVVLNASHNAIEWFIANQDLQEVFQLETLDLTDNNLLFFPFLPTHSRLRNLHLSQNRVSFYEHLADTAAYPNWKTSVQFYNLRGNMSNVTAKLWDESLHGDISSLDLLDLSGNQVHYFPQGFISKMPSLTRLRMWTNCLEVLNLTLEKLPGTLYELDVSNNRLTELHADQVSLRKLGNLSFLNLSQNDLQTLPAQLLSSLTSISSVDISYNRVGVCPLEAGGGGIGGGNQSDCVVCRNIISLRYLYLSGCNLGRLPSSVFVGTPLTHLELSNNPELIIGPRSIAGLSRTLHHLGLGNTGLRHFDFSPFHHLKSLNISRNSLTQLPASLQRLELELLDLRDNKLTTVPSAQAIVLATKLHTVFLNGNTFNCCQLDWYRTFEKTVTIMDLSDISCQDLTKRTHRVVLVDSLICGGSEGESVYWYILLFIVPVLCLVGMAVIFQLTFRPRLLPTAVRNKCWSHLPCVVEEKSQKEDTGRVQIPILEI
ncbi:transforming growth factor beta activator LRRC33 isoform X1 [Oncorhynchus kisutch]|uniref:Negative regulator of reactive oxygen species n=2 Tax=Oncorhynchus kisutch TaxID=8019 RepID=A0A8C7CM15_ONCKI|nr:transforming growth factor beta activator LRRC33-like isoform X1 [Oncorhynchus kisutch]